MTGFVQIIEFKTSRIDEVQKLSEEVRASMSGRGGGPTRITVLADRDRPNTYLTIAEFPSLEVAEANSKSADTSEFAGKMAALCDGPPTFYNTDLMQQEVMS